GTDQGTGSGPPGAGEGGGLDAAAPSERADRAAASRPSGGAGPPLPPAGGGQGCTSTGRAVPAGPARRNPGKQDRAPSPGAGRRAPENALVSPPVRSGRDRLGRGPCMHRRRPWSRRPAWPRSGADQPAGARAAARRPGRGEVSRKAGITAAPTSRWAAASTAMVAPLSAGPVSGRKDTARTAPASTPQLP